MDSPEILKNIIRRERKARKQAEAIIEQKALEIYLANQKLLSLNESLEEKILVRTREIETSKEALRLAKEKAEAATRAKSEFLSNMSHEIRTPLNAINGMIELIIQDSQDELAKQYASSIQYSGKNLLHIINEILDFSKIEAGKVTFEKTPFKLRTLLKGLEDTFRHKAKDKSITFITEIDQKLPEVLIGDPTKLNQIVLNLIGNAFKFTEKGYIRVYFKLVRQKGKQCHILARVEDTGVGIPKNKQGDIFETFTQANNSTTRLYGGTGLGLAITKKLVELQGGKIWLESEPGQGTTFSFELSFGLGEKVAEKKELSQQRDFSMLKQLKVLIVEDIPVNRFLMKQVFKRKEIPCHFAENGKEAISMLSKHTYDLVLMDLHMPIMDGFEATRIIRSLDSPTLDHEVPIIALSADAFEATQKEILEIGMDGFLSKPVDINALYDTLLNLVLLTDLDE